MFSCLKRKDKTQYECVNLLARAETRFSDKEIDILRKRFTQMTKGSKFISKEQFTHNMGVLGLDTVSCLGDALFSAMDQDIDGHLEFDEFVRYFDKITYGTEEEKAEISFRLIDQKRNGYFTFEDFHLAMEQLIRSWILMRGNPLEDEVNEHLEKRIREIFNLMDKNKDQNISLSEYIIALKKNPQIIDIFEFLKKGVTQTIKENKHRRDQIMLGEFNQIQSKTHSIAQTMQEKSHQDLFVKTVKKVISKNRYQSEEKFGVDYLLGSRLMTNVKEITVSKQDPKLDWIDQMEALHLKQKYKETYAKLQMLEEYVGKSLSKMEELYHEKLNQEEDQIVECNNLILIKHTSVGNNKTQGSSVQIGQENWNLVIQMMIGIQMSVKTASAVLDRTVSEYDFQLKNCFELMSQPIGFQQQSRIKSKFFDYAPKVFNQIRKSQMIDGDAYLSSIGPETLLSSIIQGDMSVLSELTSTGKSGSFFYYSQDGQYTLKTISKLEFRLFKKILFNYFNYLEANPKSLIIKLYGLHKIKMRGQKICFIVMGNVFNTDFKIHKKYDIKGSMYKRTTNENADLDIARKDQDFLNHNESLTIDKSKAQQLIEQLERDADFFASNNILDYSLLIGIHNLEKNNPDKIVESNELKIMKSIHNDRVFFFGVIDILTEFSTKKLLEFCCKRVVQGPTISAIPPKDYSERFKLFIRTIFSAPYD